MELHAALEQSGWVGIGAASGRRPGGSMSGIGMKRQVPGSFELVVERVQSALQAEGFGLLTRVDVQEHLRQKLGAESRRYLVLGACDPRLLQQAMLADLGVGVLLPCNVAIYEDDAGRVVVMAVDPIRTLGASTPELAGVAAELRTRLRSMLERLAPGA